MKEAKNKATMATKAASEAERLSEEAQNKAASVAQIAETVSQTAKTATTAKTVADVKAIATQIDTITKSAAEQTDAVANATINAERQRKEAELHASTVAKAESLVIDAVKVAKETVQQWHDAAAKAILDTPPFIEFIGHTDSVGSVIFSPDGKKIVSGSNDKTVRIWNAESGVVLRTSWEHADSVRSVAFSPNGEKFATASADNTARIWDAKSIRVLRTLNDWEHHAHLWRQF